MLETSTDWQTRLDDGRAALQRRALDEAETALSVALRMAESEGEPSRLATSLNLLARVNALRGRPFVAAALLRRQLTIEEASLGDEHLQLAATLGNLGEMYAQLEAPRDELEVRQRALDLRHRLDPDASPALITRLEARIAQLRLRIAEEASLDLTPAEGRARIVTPVVVEGIPREARASHAAWVAFLSGAGDTEEQVESPARRRAVPRRVIAAAVAALLLLAVTAWAVSIRSGEPVAATRAGMLESGGAVITP
jgi:tetratricopeptide (TPR) repeat protein